MRRFASPILLLALISIGASAESPPTTVQYIANEGFLIEVGDAKVLIDALFDDRTIAYAHVPDEQTLARMTKAEPPFDDIDVILATHRHRDHFSIGPVFERLSNDPSVVFVGPPQAVEGLRIVASDLEDLLGRVREVDVELFASAKIEVSGISIRAIHFRHSPYMVTDPETGQEYNRHEGIENLIYLIEMNGVRLLHVGDATLTHNLEFFTGEPFPGGPIDIVFLEFFDWSEETKAILDRWIQPDHVVFMHLPREKEKIAAIEQNLLATFPNAVVFAEPLEERIFAPGSAQ
jgi:L-ascorbate metabolism protein UlaG (beta-lactamase superfamily)